MIRAGTILALGVVTAVQASAQVAPATAQATQATAPAANVAAEAVSPEVASFDLGLMIGGQLANSGLAASVARDELMRGISAGLGGTLPSAQQKDDAQRFSHGAREALAARNTGVAEEFLGKNAHAKGIKLLPSGLQYRVLAAGDPKAALPGPNDRITVRYRASLPDGTEIDRSDDHGQPPVFRLNSTIKAWNEALAAMRPGDKWQLFVPPQLGYGTNSPPPIPPGSLLIYEIELLRVEVTPAEPAAKKP